MKLKAALEYEKLREDRESWNKIILHQDGKFYHAYEWSAWLIKAFAEKDMDVKDGLRVLLYKTTNAEYLIGGFPLESLSKFIPVYVDAKPIDDKCLSVEIELPSDCDYEQLLSEFNAWRETCPVQESKKMLSKSQITNNQTSAELGRSGMFGILVQVLSYPVERSTPQENIEFISKLKQELSSLL